MKEFLDTKMLAIRVFDPQATRAILRMNVQVNDWNFTFFRDLTIFSTDLIHFRPPVYVYVI